MTITLGWWVIPVLVMAVLVGLAIGFTPRDSGGYGGIGSGLVGLFYLMAAAVVSLVVFVVYMALRVAGWIGA